MKNGFYHAIFNVGMIIRLSLIEWLIHSFAEPDAVFNRFLANDIDITDTNRTVL